jgi:hypothetical protein
MLATFARRKRGIAVDQTSTRTRATAVVTVQSSHSEPFCTVGPAKLKILTLAETFTGDIDGTSQVRALQYISAEGGVSQVSLQSFEGTLGGRRGSFVLQGSGTVDKGSIESRWFVVPGSGTDELTGLRGEGGFKGQFGQGSEARLDYWFE